MPTARAQEAPAFPVKAPQGQVFSSTVPSEAGGWRPASDFPDIIDHLPFKLSFGETLNYNDNLLLLPNGAPVAPNFRKGDFYSTTNIGVSSRVPVGAQAFFVDGNYGITRYAHDSGLNASTYLVDAGMDWVFTSRCSGRLIVADQQAQAPIEELTSFTVNNIQTASAKESAKCRVGDNVNVIMDSGLSRTTNSLASLSVNDYDQYYIRGGTEYDFADLNTLGAKVTYTKSDYFNRSAVATPGLATSLEQTEYAFYYRRLFSPKLEIDVAAGFTQTNVISPLSSSSFTNPTYSATVKWNATPRLSLIATASQTVAPPQNIIADFERIRTGSLAANYFFSPKLSFNASVGLSSLDNPTESGIGGSPILVNQKVFYTDLRAIYQFSPLMQGFADYRYTHRKDETNNTLATANIFMLGLRYQR